MAELFGRDKSVISRHLRNVFRSGELKREATVAKNATVNREVVREMEYFNLDGFARYMRDALPGASFIAFTGTPIELQDANTRTVFGDYISVYDIQRAVDDGATVPIYCQSRLAKLALNEVEVGLSPSGCCAKC